MHTPACPKKERKIYFFEPWEWYKLQVRYYTGTAHTVHPHWQPITLILLISFHIRRTQGDIKKYKGIQWTDSCSNKREGQLRYNTKLFHTANENKIPSLIGSKWFTMALRHKQKNGYTLQSIKGADMKRIKTKGEARVYTEWEGLSCLCLPYWSWLQLPQLWEHLGDRTHISRF